MNKKRLKKYAQLIVEKGINVQKKRKYYIDAPCEQYEFASYVAKLLYQKGASYVEIIYNDTNVKKASLKYGKEEDLLSFPDYEIDMYKTFQEQRYGRIILKSPNPNENEGLDINKITRVQKQRSKVFSPFRKTYMENETEWCIACVPNAIWAKKVFPNLTTKKAIEALWDAILNACYVKEDNNPLKDWDEHDSFLKRRAAYLDEKEFVSLHYTSDNGTDFEVGLVNNYLFEGGSSSTKENVKFHANMPSMEIFSMPHNQKAEGVLYATKPLLINGFLINSFGFRFHEGKVIEVLCDNKEDKKVLEDLINTDENTCRLGEVALVSYSSPINQMGILFYNTLFDENASCHFALGQSYKTNMKNSSSLSEEELYALGGNHSHIHVDFMVSDNTTKIVGTTKKGEQIVLMDKGEFTF